MKKLIIRFLESINRRNRAISEELAALSLVGLALSAGTVVVIFSVTLIVALIASMGVNYIQVRAISYEAFDDNSDSFIDHIVVRIENNGMNTPYIDTATIKVNDKISLIGKENLEKMKKDYYKLRGW